MKGAKPKQSAARRPAKPKNSDVEILSAHPIDHVQGITKPDRIQENERLSHYWDFICPEINNFGSPDVPLLSTLCEQYVLLEKTTEELTIFDDNGNATGVKVLAENSKGDMKEHPALKARKQLVSEIRALSDILGLSPLARSRIGLLDAVKTKSAADTAATFYKLKDAYEQKLIEDK